MKWNTTDFTWTWYDWGISTRRWVWVPPPPPPPQSPYAKRLCRFQSWRFECASARSHSVYDCCGRSACACTQMCEGFSGMHARMHACIHTLSHTQNAFIYVWIFLYVEWEMLHAKLTIRNVFSFFHSLCCDLYDMTSYWLRSWYDLVLTILWIWYDMIWYDTTWFDYMIRYDDMFFFFNICDMIW